MSNFLMEERNFAGFDLPYLKTAFPSRRLKALYLPDEIR